MQYRLLVIEPSDAIRKELQASLSARHEVLCLDGGQEIREQIVQFQPEVILLDFQLPQDSAIEICTAVRRQFPERQIQILIFGGGMTEAQRLEAFSAGADDIVDISIGRRELAAKIDVHMRLRGALLRATTAERKLEGYSRELERIVDARSLAIQSTQDIAVFALAKLADSRDPETGEHLIRMRAYTQMIAEQLQFSGPYQEQIDQQFLQDLFRSSPLHDIGKVGVSDAILLKPGRLTPEEFGLMKQHVAIGAETLEQAAKSSPSGSFFHMAAQIARYHHERWDGTGYLEGLEGPAIPLPARIVSVADVFDALTSKRVYKDAIPPETARQMIVDESGTQFDPAVVAAFEQCYDKLLAFTAETGHFMRFQATAQPHLANYHWGKHQPTAELGAADNILVIDNGAESLRLITAWLRAAGLNIRCCEHFKDALALVKDDCPKLIITDWILDSLEGEIFCRWIREERLPQYVYMMVLADAANLHQSAKAYHVGVDEVLTQSVSREELLSRLTSAVRVIELENHLRTVERNDPLTGLATLRYLNDQLKREWHRAKNYRLPLACVVIDVDDFSTINHLHGAEIGDLVLQELAATIQKECRNLDYLCRLECDRMLLVLPECAEVNAFRIAKRIEMAIDDIRVDDGEAEVRCSASMGIAQRNTDTPNLEAVIDNAEEALRMAKKAGKRRVVSYRDCHESIGFDNDEDHVRDSLEHMAASEIMTTPILCVRESDTIAQAVQLLLKNGFNSAPVVDAEGILAGVISEKDLMQALRQPGAWQLPVSRAMRSDVIRFEETDPAIHVYEFLSNAAIRRVIIIKDGRPTGVISRGNCLRFIHPVEGKPAEADTSKLAALMVSGILENATLRQIREMLGEFNEPALSPGAVDI